MPELKYTNEHECIKVDGDIAWVGITKYAQDALGDLVYVELPVIGKKVKKGEHFAVVESVKTAAEVYSPIDGEVVGVNDNMPDNLDMIKSPVGEQGWIAKIKISDKAQLANLMDETAYKKYIESL
jgi:glycine cleavage system H protein